MNFDESTLALVIVQAGHIFVGRAIGGADGTMQLYNARPLQRWGTERGLGQLHDGPTKNTIMGDRVPLILLPVPQIIYVLPVSENPDWGV